ncbi:hypothetical protein C6990_03120 [Nitrosopumilus sp. b3]|nr:hypothetical protein C6990_03120 [Nitrosopumilus sp. b3]
MQVFGLACLKGKGIVLGLMLISSIIMPNLLAEAFGEKPTITEIRCKNHLSNYIKLGEVMYKERYKNNRIVDSCIQLFKDSNSELYFNPSIIKVSQNNNMSFELTYNKAIGEKYHLLKYHVCNDEEKSKNKILFQSNSEKSLIVLPKKLLSKQCADFWTEISSGNVDSIKLSWDSGKEKSLKVRKTFQ